MSEIQCVCPFCSSMFSVDGSYEGQVVPCPSCGNDFPVQRMPVASMPAHAFPPQQQFQSADQRKPKTQENSSVKEMVFSAIGLVLLIALFALKFLVRMKR